MLLPLNDASLIHGQIQGALSDGVGGFILPCNTNATVALTFAGQTFKIDPRDLVKNAVPVGDGPLGTYCASGIATFEGLGQDVWLVSVIFLFLFFDHLYILLF